MLPVLQVGVVELVLGVRSVDFCITSQESHLKSFPDISAHTGLLP